jgi:hypothetical protein
MNNTLEDRMRWEYVDHSTAVRLKSIGFDLTCCRYIFTGDTGNNYDHYLEVKPSDAEDWNGSSDLCISQPTYQQVFTWFRRRHNIFPEILTDCTAEPKFCYTYTRFFGNPNDLSSEEWGWEEGIGGNSLLYRTFEEAEEECVQELIKIFEQ